MRPVRRHRRPAPGGRIQCQPWPGARPGRRNPGWNVSSPVEQILAAAAAFDARQLGLAHPGRVLANGSAAALVEQAVARREGVLTDLGALSAFTGPRTGRSPKDKYTVRGGASAAQIDWSANQPMDPAAFARLRDLVRAYLQNRDLFVFDGFACADPRHRLPLRVVTERAWHSLFARCLFLRPRAEELAGFRPEWTILHACDFH